MDNWYEMKDKDYNQFALKFPIEVNLKVQKDKMVTMDNWCNEMKIRATPTIFVNGYELPVEYKVADLKYF
ncbi:hypothetical protein KUH03_31135 [Sphingobacterium sp. E70]|uniref:hypothetical protein n=1 Tax=Sphingobacterium sp. E70 TaxID=2853439 RepID=UPI00211CF666|nr:hypothetical protein [Sphingobacterium sp. E70]ULT23591.1 hypothetical protein KUH03_31135 [Sphingobacterium sp. E70]